MVDPLGWMDDEIKDWENFHVTLRQPDKDYFQKMMDEVIQFQGTDPTNKTTESFLMSLILMQQKMITKLISEYSLDKYQ